MGCVISLFWDFLGPFYNLIRDLKFGIFSYPACHYGVSKVSCSQEFFLPILLIFAGFDFVQETRVRRCYSGDVFFGGWL